MREKKRESEAKMDGETIYRKGQHVRTNRFVDVGCWRKRRHREFVDFSYVVVVTVERGLQLAYVGDSMY